MAHDLIFYANRSTPQVVARGAKGKPKKGYGKQVRRRKATAAEEKTIRRGGWVRVDSKGRKPSSGSYKPSKYRKKLGKKRRATNAKIRRKKGGTKRKGTKRRKTTRRRRKR